MPSFLLLVFLIAVLVAMAVVLMRGQSAESSRHAAARLRLQKVVDLAWLHDEISPALAGAVIDRTRGLGPESSVQELESALDDVLDISRRHRAEEPDLATIFIDTVRSNELG